MTEVVQGLSRRSSRRTASAPPARRQQTRCADPVDFECGFLRQQSDSDCIEPEARPPFVVRRVIYAFNFQNIDRMSSSLSSSLARVHVV